MNISVVIPTYNRRCSVQSAIQSVIDQSLKADEIIVVDDGSDDSTGEVLRKEFPLVKLIRQDNAGVSAARNHGIREAAGEWIGFLDSDDLWHQDKLFRQVTALRRNCDYQACHCDEIWIRNGKRVNPMNKHAKPEGWIFKNCLARCCVSPSAVLVRKDLLESAGLFDENLPACEDYDLWLRIFSRVPILLVAEKLVTKFGGHDDQLSRKHWGMDRFRVRSLVNLLDGGQLNSEFQRLAIVALNEKLSILINGCDKRGNTQQSARYRAIQARWSDRTC